MYKKADFAYFIALLNHVLWYLIDYTDDIETSWSMWKDLFHTSVWVDKRKKQAVNTPVMTKLLPSRQIMYSTQQVVYLAHANMHANHLLVYSGCHYCKQVL